VQSGELKPYQEFISNFQKVYKSRDSI